MTIKERATSRGGAGLYRDVRKCLTGGVELKDGGANGGCGAGYGAAESYSDGHY
jgi:hypothetical protein